MSNRRGVLANSRQITQMDGFHRSFDFLGGLRKFVRTFCIIRFCAYRKYTMRLLQKALTFDDVLLVPAYSNILPANTSLRTKLTRNLSLNIPVISAAMDTVTEARLA